ncbi:hypothetical protein [Paenibacillus wulumuqiensis]|nr:hypothetical protein [Paenibacillus wulumuqiensis]
MDILAYACVAIMFLFVVSRLLSYAFRRKKAPSEEELEKQLLAAVNERE